VKPGMQLHLLRLACFVVVLVLARGAGAEPELNDAPAAFARGKQLFAAKDYLRAAAAFERAYQLSPHHAVQCSIALCYANLNRFVEAAEHYQRCLKEGADGTEKAELIRESLKKAEARIAWIEVVSPGVEGTVFVDGKSVGVAPRKVPLDSGSHVIEVRRPGARPASRAVTLFGGEQQTLTLVPEPFETAPPKTMEAVPPKPPPPPPPRSRRRLSPAWFWTTVGVTVAMAAASAAFGGLAVKRRSDYESHPTADGYDSFVNARTISNVFFGLAVAAGGTGTVLFFYTDFSRRRSSTEPAVAGVGLRGSF
jgi:hypothetical protein